VDTEETSIGVALAAFAAHGERTAITHAYGEWTYADLLERIYRAARALGRRGLGRGDSIALLTKNHPETFVLRYAANVLGCCVTVLNDGLAPPVVADMLHATDASVLVFAPAHHTEHAFVVLRDASRVSLFALGASNLAPDITALAAAEPADPVAVRARPADLAAIQLSGGSTGVPKGIPRDFRVPPFFAPQALRIWKDTVQLLCTQLSRVAGTMAGMVLAGGGRVVLHEQFDSAAVLGDIERERATFLSLVPSLLYRLLDAPEIASTDVSSVRSIVIGGRAASPERLAKAVEVFGPIIRQDYGASECGRIAELSPDEHLRPELLDTVGRPIPSVEVTIRDKSGLPVEGDAIGEIWMRGPAIMTGYYKQPEETAKVLCDGWYRTGDLGRMRPTGYLVLAGRTKEIIHGAWGKVYPAEVENALLRHPAIRDAVVFGTIVPDREECLCAAVTVGDAASMSEDDATKWVTDRLGFRYAPEVVLVLEEIPVTGAQKPDLPALRVLVAGRDT
jgi:fatty-acyl-CoA synthase